MAVRGAAGSEAKQGKCDPSPAAEFPAKLTALRIKTVNEYHPSQRPK
jgi:hypothetical protein